MALQISPKEAFLLSRIDGLLSEEELALVVGCDIEALRAVIKRLETQGAVEFEEGDSPRTVSLDCEGQERLSFLVSRLDDISYYELLDIPLDAREEEIRDKFYELALVCLHQLASPNGLGLLELGLKRLVDEATFAYETLRSPDRRAAYDTYVVQASCKLAGDASSDRASACPRSKPTIGPAYKPALPRPSGRVPSRYPGSAACQARRPSQKPTWAPAPRTYRPPHYSRDPNPSFRRFAPQAADMPHVTHAGEVPHATPPKSELNRPLTAQRLARTLTEASGSPSAPSASSPSDGRPAGPSDQGPGPKVPGVRRKAILRP